MLQITGPFGPQRCARFQRPSPRETQLSNELQDVETEHGRQSRQAQDLVEQHQLRNMQASAQISEASVKLQEAERTR